MICNVKSRSWYVELHSKYKDDFSDFKEVYKQMTKFEFDQNISGRITILDAAHLYLLVRHYMPYIIMETEGNNGFITSLIATALKKSNKDFRILIREKHPGPRIAAFERAKYFGYTQNIIGLNDESDNEIKAKLKMFGKIDFVILRNNIQFNNILKYINNKATAFFIGEHPIINLSCSHVQQYMMPDELDHKDLIIGNWWDILDSWDYISFGDQIFNKPYSTALFWE